MNPLDSKSFFYRFAKHFEYLFGTFFLPVNSFIEALNFGNLGRPALAGLILSLGFLYWELSSLLIKEHRKELSMAKIKNFNTVYTFTMAYTMASIMISCHAFVSQDLETAAYLALLALAFTGKFLVLKRVQAQLF